MSQYTAIFDACVLYPAPLRDLLMHLALTDLLRAKWTEAIHEEWIRSVLKNRPDLTRRQLERTRQLMNAHVRDCLVADYEDLIPVLTLPDPDDRHVLAAAIRSSADVIVTFNLADFPPEVLKKWGIERSTRTTSSTTCSTSPRTSSVSPRNAGGRASRTRLCPLTSSWRHWNDRN